MKKHYHVLQGLDGLYMPNSNDVCTTKAEATACAIEAVKLAKDAQAQGQDYKPRAQWELGADEFPWEGSAKEGYWTNGIECIQIDECSDPGCLRDPDDEPEAMCPMCGSVVYAPLGTLGTIGYARCRACGTDYALNA